MSVVLTKERKEILPSDLVAVVEDGGAIDAAGKSDTQREGTEENGHGEDELPDGDTKGKAHEHCYGRSEGDDGEPKCDGARGLVGERRDEQDGEQQGNGKRDGELLGISLIIRKGANGGKEGGIEQIAEKEVEEEHPDK